MMRLPTSRLMIGSSLAIAVVGSVAALTWAARDGREGLAPASDASPALVRTAEAGDSKTPQAPPPAQSDAGSVRVDAPGTNVEVDKDRGKVRVEAPYTKVNVDPDKGSVRVRAPYVNLDIRW